MTNGKVILGLGFGDEGKGLTTSYLCSITKNPLVVRFNGGHQAGHTVFYNQRRHVFSSFGSGTLQGFPTYWSKYCTFYPTAFINEYKLLSNPLFFIHPLSPVTTPYDLEFNRLKAKENGHGSVGVGFGATIQRQENHYNLFAQDLFYEKVFLEKLKNIRSHYGFTLDETIFRENVQKVKELISLSHENILKDFNPIFEGAQGILLDQDFGFFPNVTRSNTTSKNALEMQQELEVFYVTRTYQTRHGNGFMSNQNDVPALLNNENETNRPHLYQGDFRTSKLDLELLNYSLACDNNFTKGLKKNLVITCVDQLNADIEKIVSSLSANFEHVYISEGASLEDITILR